MCSNPFHQGMLIPSHQLVRARTKALPAPFAAVAPRARGAPNTCCQVRAGDTGVVTTTPGPNFCELDTSGGVNQGEWQRRTAGRSQSGWYLVDDLTSPGITSRRANMPVRISVDVREQTALIPRMPAQCY